MATIVIYNGVELHNVLTREWDEEAVYDSSGTDLLYRHIKMRFDGILHRVYGPSSEYQNDGWGPVFIKSPTGEQGTIALFQAVQPRLLMPRQQLQVFIDDTEVLSAAPAPLVSDVGKMDLNNGPRPQAASVTRIAGDQLFQLQFSIECAIDAAGSPIDYSALGGGTLVINNRWSTSETVGDNFAITRTIRGRLRLSTWAVNAHAFRYLVVPGLEASFRRERMDFQVAENGLDCNYTIVDHQVKVAAPWPACKLTADYTESTNDGVTYWGEVSVRLEGPLNASVQAMIIQAMRIADTRLHFAESDTQGMAKSYTLAMGSITEQIGETNVVEVHVRLQHIPPTDVGMVQGLLLENFGQGSYGVEKILDLSGYVPLGPNAYSFLQSQVPRLLGYLPGTEQPRQAAFLYALSCYYQDPWHPQGATQLSGGVPFGNNPVTSPVVSVSCPTTPTNPPSTTKLSGQTRSAVYTYTRALARYTSIIPRVQLPLASGNAPTEAGDTCVVASLAQGIGRVEVHYDSERVGAWPEIPGCPDTYRDGNGFTGTLLKSWDNLLPPGLAADKTQTIYRIESYRLYALNRRPFPYERVCTGVLPHTNLTQQDNAVAFSDVVSPRLTIGDP